MEMYQPFKNLSIKNLGIDYPNQETSGLQYKQWGNLYGVNVDESGLVIPSRPLVTKSKIADSFEDARNRIDKARLEGKQILLLPGSYDLVHAGHLSYALQAIDLTNESLERQKKGRSLFTAILVDDDRLIEEVKRDIYLKVTGETGPIEKIVDGVSPRLEALASFPVDLVAFVPGPTSRADWFEPVGLSDLKKDPKVNYPQGVERALNSYPSLVERINAGQELDFNPDFWSVELWQLFLLSSLNRLSLVNGFRGVSMIRAVSQEDGKYIKEASAVASISGLQTEVLNDIFCLSSKEIVERLGVKGALDKKRSYLETFAT